MVLEFRQKLRKSKFRHSLAVTSSRHYLIVRTYSDTELGFDGTEMTPTRNSVVY